MVTVIYAATRRFYHACSLRVRLALKLKPVCSIYCTQCRDHIYSAHLRWRMVYQRLFYQRRYKEIASQLFVCPKTVSFLNSGDVKPYRLGRPTGRASSFDHEESIHNGLYSSNASDAAT